MLFEAFLQVSTLLIVEAARVAAVVPGEDATFGIDLAAKSIAPAFGKNFEPPGLGMVAPDLLPHGFRDRFVVEPGAKNVGSDGAALAGIEPAVGTPMQTVDDRVSVLEAETGKQDFRVAIRNVVVVAIGVKQKIRRIENEDAAAAADGSSHNVQAFDECGVLFIRSVAVGIFINA